MEIFISKSEAETIEKGMEFAKQLRPGSFVALYGDLGAGKTQFVKGVCRNFEVRETVNSPTFTIVNEYHGKIPVFHIDLYRMKDLDEIFGIGFDEYLDAGGICLVEWAEKLDGIIPDSRYEVKMSIVDDSTREIAIAYVDGRN
ncbi:MAG: tRNA (adenosine(37)-N6)-threonylcarbamoyltransferase complex ATPase subunit type 1 TsaE [Bacteroidetes bacterium]|jgi:tRNA threonylcarbamoyladenosine biosynthesis protein TsaE|nr:tRNA (adenosine(37)-N6)-threonylcarbamoyltransferase complex ATPase subunit type 1 TsaE [Bacteroidota bacterium]MCL5034152.1 tRNA (adenosine(37)-N6)-threonylcarbamoyltransferase complex ATPase subunit type 1 TsaE [Bacteroidota bacterium]